MKNGYLINPKDSQDIRKALNFFRENKGIIKVFSNNSFKKCSKYYVEDYVCDLFVNEILKKI